uniref:Uncharacterized protein n=1 Tax=Photinus pyralis TaxID=7054 RepID=A0A1Y1NJT3_PHOPY
MREQNSASILDPGSMEQLPLPMLVPCTQTTSDPFLSGMEYLLSLPLQFLPHLSLCAALIHVRYSGNAGACCNIPHVGGLCSCLLSASCVGLRGLRGGDNERQGM